MDEKEGFLSQLKQSLKERRDDGDDGGESGIVIVSRLDWNFC